MLTCVPVIEDRIFSPLALASSTSTDSWALTPVMIFFSSEFYAKGFLPSESVFRINIMSFMSRFCLVGDKSLFCALCSHSTPTSSCIAQFISTHAGVDKSHVRRCHSVNPLPRVNPPVFLRLLISTCSITRSVDKLAQ